MAGNKSIGERISALGNLFLGFNIGNAKDGSQVIYLEVAFPEGYGVSSLVEKKFNVKSVKTQKGPNTYYFYTPLLTVGFDNVFDAVEFNIKANEEAQERRIFLAEKIKELEKIVSEEPMEKLKTLEFKFIPKRKNKASSIPAEIENKEEEKEDDGVA